MLTRRDFLQNSMILGASGLLSPSILLGNDGSSFNDYKALVVVYLDGGNDGVNTFVPIGAGNGEYGYSAYRNAREPVAVEDTDLGSRLKQAMDADGYLALSKFSGNPYFRKDDEQHNYQTGFYAHDKGYDKNGNSLNLNFANKIGTHGYMPELANLVNQGKVAVIQNVGNLHKPTTRKEIVDGNAVLPPFLMAHDHQSTLAFTGNAMVLRDYGLMGRLADAWKGINGDSIYGSNISFYERCQMLYGNKTSPVIFGSTGMVRFDANNYDYTDYYNLMKWHRNDNWMRYYNHLHKHAFDAASKINSDWRQYSAIYDNLTNSYGEPLKNRTSDHNAALGHAGVGNWEPNFIGAAKAIVIGEDSGLKRQVIYIRLASFDTHGRQRRYHGYYLRGLSLAIDKFQKIIDAKGLTDKVALMTISDFGRSVGANTDGTDHAWGNNLFVVGGGVKGGVYGKAPSLKLGGEDDMSYKGRLIPTTSMAQYYNTVLKWFGADEDLRKKLLPDLKNFDRSTHDVGFMES